MKLVAGLVFLIAVVSCGRVAVVGGTYECSFARIQGTYFADENELRRVSLKLVKVTRDNRTFMFPRDQLTQCREVNK